VNLPLKWKIILGITITSIASAIIAVTLIVEIEKGRIEQKIITEAQTISKITGGNTTGALAFSDVESAHEALSPLRANPHIHEVAIFDDGDAPFAWYQWSGNKDDKPRLGDAENFPRSIPSSPKKTQVTITDNTLEIFEPIVSEDETVGTIYMSVDLDEIADTTSYFYQITAFICIGIAVLSLVLAFIIQNAITKPINQVVQALKDIAQGEGDLTQRLRVNSNDELGELANWFNVFVEKIQGVITQFRENANDLSSSASVLKQHSQNTNNAIVKQETELDQIATAVNEMSSTVQEVERNIASSTKDTEEADNQANLGNQVVVETMSAISVLANDIETASEVIADLQQNSESIGAVLDVIRGVAEQTNLLALNAAIEAARAGEQGRGFAVVADEVRTLASRTQQSTEEIHEMIEKLQVGAKEAVQVMDKGRNQAHSSVKKAEQASESLTAITQAVAIIKDMSLQVASASTQQSNVTEEISRNIVNISQVATSTSEESKEMTQKSMQLDQLSTDMLELVSQFKV
jgi:methyl-accepting chemotaxis protein